MKRWASAAAAVWMVAAAMGQPVDATWRDAKAEEVSPPAPMREFRGAWVATVANIDWPTSRMATVAQQRVEMAQMLDAMKAANFNAVVFQVRPSCDAFYKSELEPWSEFLTGESGKGPAEEFDPLAEWIREAHARGMELHAWVNPFRARHFDAKKPDAATHVSRTTPELVKAYDRFLWLDPGEAEAQEHTFRVIADITARYDIDGLHIDDYFYPYPKGTEPFPDGPSWTRYKDDGGSLSRDDWRRDNINRFVKRLYETTKATKKHVKVGISPFGIWRPDHPAGVKGMDAYEKLYADAKLWLREGWLDYCSPQLYWKVDAPQQAFVPLLKWWEGENVKARSMWPGLYPSRLLPGELEKNAGWTAEEVVKQVGLIREHVRLGPGSVHFSAKAIVADAAGVRTAMARGPFLAPALVPAMPWLDDAPPAAPLLSVEPDVKGGIAVRWTAASATDEAAQVWAVAVRAGEVWTTIIAPGGERNFTATGTGIDAVAIWAVDRAGNLSAPAVMVR